jgi:hypothetical protein
MDDSFPGIQYRFHFSHNFTFPHDNIKSPEGTVPSTIPLPISDSKFVYHLQALFTTHSFLLARIRVLSLTLLLGSHDHLLQSADITKQIPEPTHFIFKDRGRMFFQNISTH